MATISAGSGVMSRRCNLPVYANPATHRAAESRIKKLHHRYEFAAGTGFDLDDLHIHPFCISHDTVDPVGFLVSDGTYSVAYCTDTATLIRQRLRQCNALILEANCDPEMLRTGPYPMYIKQRVRSNQGHLANNDATAFLVELRTTEVQHVVLAHLSETNNHPDLVSAYFRRELARFQPTFSLELARQDQPGRVITVGESMIDGLRESGKELTPLI